MFCPHARVFLQVAILLLSCLLLSGCVLADFTAEEQEALAELRKAGLLDDSMGFLLDEKLPFGGLVDAAKIEKRRDDGQGDEAEDKADNDYEEEDDENDELDLDDVDDDGGNHGKIAG